MRKRLYTLIGIILLAVAVTGTVLAMDHANDRASISPAASSRAPKNPAAQSKGFDKSQYSLTDPASIWVIVNKQHPLQPADYIPAGLRAPAVSLRTPGQPNMSMRTATAAALEQLFGAAATGGVHLQVASAYRSYSYQQSVYKGYVDNSGQITADQESARPGYSEHQTGLAVDIAAQDNTCTLEACFGTTPEGKWLTANAYQYGFILRYPADKVAVTGYEYEPWHFRYVGTGLATEMHNQHIETLEEFFGVKGGTTYN